ncbi:Regulator of telomere elongation helicase 1 [Liparis tanakae]|uniref:Regulator of telomere elongation helicase 1 n=1 Tax=Liparis tanakae TaxID=230148 RepID=A0A4Z2E3C0_9TELE|nr:Regulator of telomere elongation helicase 1 [Liparis tanakae]
MTTDMFFPPAAASSSASCSQLDTQQLNQGGPHLNQQGPGGPQADAAPGVHAFLSDVRSAIGEEKSALLFQALRSFRRTGGYEELEATAVSLLTERDQDFTLLARFGRFLPARHRSRYQALLGALSGADLQRPPVPSSLPFKTQSKIPFKKL